MEIKYCRRCGGPLSLLSNNAYTCPKAHAIYRNPSPGVNVYLLNTLNELAVTTRGLDPGKGEFDILGGFVDGAESLEEAGARELKEEAGLNPDQYLPLQYIRSGTDVYEFKGEKITVLGTSFWTRLKPGVIPVPSDDVTEIRFIPLADVDPSIFFFSNVRIGASEFKRLFL